MVFKPTHAEHIELAFQCLNLSANRQDLKSYIGKCNRTNKRLKQRCFSSNRIIFLLKTMKPIKSYQNCALFDLMSMNLTWKAEVGTLILEQYSFQNVS